MARAAGAAAALLLALALGRGLAAAEPAREALNVVLISLDTLRADRTSLYGGPRPTTPTLDELATRAVRFTHAYSPSPWTLPAHAAMLTGRYPEALSRDPDAALYALAPLLSTRLREHGYATAAVTGGAFVAADFGADRGFDRFAEGDVADAVAWIASGPRVPFFLFFHTYVAHMPYRDRRFVGDADGGRLAAIYEGEQPVWEPLHMQVCCAGMELTESEKEFLLRLYDGGVAAADEMVGKILAALRSAGALERTIVVVTSDHGEEFWDHTGRAAYHGHTLYDELLRVPLLWYEPALAHPGSTREERVGLIDLVPTILARIGIRVPDGLDGRDLSPLLDGGSWDPTRPLFAGSIRHGPRRHGVIAPAGKLIVTPHPSVQHGEGRTYPVPTASERQLYLPDDPTERRERSGEHPQLRATLMRALRTHHDAVIPTSPPARTGPLEPATQDRLRALGYVE
jgi:arylsulfatase A-like enzyme